MATPARIQSKTARLGSRCTREQKLKVQRAAELAGTSVTDFTINTLMEKADEIIRHHYMIELSIKDQMNFAKTLLSPPEPNATLLKAKKHHQRLM